MIKNVYGGENHRLEGRSDGGKEWTRDGKVACRGRERKRETAKGGRGREEKGCREREEARNCRVKYWVSVTRPCQWGGDGRAGEGLTGHARGRG